MKPTGIRLTDLKPQFLKRTDDTRWRNVKTLAEADGIFFLCPKCFKANGGSRGTHGVICWSPSVPQTTRPTPGRWNMIGTGLDDLSLVAASSSVQLNGGCAWHGFIKNGEALDA